MSACKYVEVCNPFSPPLSLPVERYTDHIQAERSHFTRNVRVLVIERHLLRNFENVIPDELTQSQLQRLVKLDKGKIANIDEAKAKLETIKKALEVIAIL
jgi:hypothetical protein